MKNITVSIPDEVYRRARVRAVEEGSSVSALVTAFLERLTGYDAEFERLEARQREIQSEIHGFSAADRLSREALHDRALR